MKGKISLTKLLKKYSNFLILIYCHYVINIFNSLLDSPDIHYLLLIQLINNFITNIFQKCIYNNMDLNSIKSILNEGCSIILDYIIISKEEKFNNNNYIPKFTDAIQFSYQKIMFKIDNYKLETKLRKNNKISNVKKKSNKQSLINKAKTECNGNILNNNESLKKNNTILSANNKILSANNKIKHNKINYKFNDLKYSNLPLQYTYKFKESISNNIEILNSLFNNYVKILFINIPKNINNELNIYNENSCNTHLNDIFYNLSYFLYESNNLSSLEKSFKNNNDLLNNIDEIDKEQEKNLEVNNFINELSYNIDIIENYMIILSNEIILLFKENKNIDNNILINNINCGFQKINKLQITQYYNNNFFNIIYIVYPYIFIKNYKKLNNTILFNINNIIINWCIDNNTWLKNLYDTHSDKKQFVSIATLKKINHHFIKSYV